MIKVLHIVPTLGYGGIAQFVLNYYNLMDKNEFHFDFITHGSVEDFHKELTEKGTKIFYFNTVSKSGIVNYYKQYKYVLRNEKYNIVHAHDGHLTGITAFFCKMWFDGPIICHAHTTLCVKKTHRPFMPLFRWMSRANGDMLLGCGNQACKYLFGPDSQYRVIHNAISIERFSGIDDVSVSKLKESLDIPIDSYVIGHVGLFTYPKNHKYLIEVFRAIYKTEKKSYLVLVGSGELVDAVRNKCIEYKIADRVRIVGKQSNIPLYMRMFDVFVLPSLWEGMPIVGIEAMASGLHCVFSNRIDREIDIGLDVDFVDISKESIKEWSKKIMRCTLTPDWEHIQNMIKAGGYDIKYSVQMLIDAYNELAGGKDN